MRSGVKNLASGGLASGLQGTSADKTLVLPPVFSFRQHRNEISFVVADLGVGIKAHLEHAYPISRTSDDDSSRLDESAASR